MTASSGQTEKEGTGEKGRQGRENTAGEPVEPGQPESLEAFAQTAARNQKQRRGEDCDPDHRHYADGQRRLCTGGEQRRERWGRPAPCKNGGHARQHDRDDTDRTPKQPGEEAAGADYGENDVHYTYGSRKVSGAQR